MRTKLARAYGSEKNITGVSADMFLQVTGCLKGLVTSITGTFVGLFPSVDSDMRLKTISSGKGLVTALKVTFEWAVTSV